MDNKPESKETRYQWLWLAAIIVFAAAMRFHGLGGRALFGDEALFHWEGTMPLAQGIQASIGDRVPPLSVVFIHFWLKLVPNYSEFWLRLPLAIFNLLSIFLLYAAGVRIAGRRAALAACLIFVMSPLMLYMGQEGRYPSIAIFLVSGALLCFITYMETSKPGWLAGFAASLAMGLYTHYFFAMIAAGYGLFVLFFLKGRQRVFSLAALAAAALLFVPWLPNFLYRAGREVGAQKETIGAYLKTKPFFAVPHVLEQFLLGQYRIEAINRVFFVVFFICTFFIFASFLAWAVRKKYGALLLFVFLFPLLSAWTLKITIDFPIKTFPYFSSCLAPVFFLCLAIGLARLKWPAAVCAGTPFFAVIAAALIFFTSHLGIGQNSGSVLGIVNAQKQAGDVFLMSPPECETLLSFYGPRDLPLIGVPRRIDVMKYNKIEWLKWPAVDAKYLNDLERELSPYRRAWMFWCGGDHPGVDYDGLVLDFMDSRYRPTMKKNFVFMPGQTKPGGGVLKLYDLKNTR
jgi:4-amino-4-deoxy-L-arabinose transferase-like glycosyltransferase